MHQHLLRLNKPQKTSHHIKNATPETEINSTHSARRPKRTLHSTQVANHSIHSQAGITRFAVTLAQHLDTPVSTQNPTPHNISILCEIPFAPLSPNQALEALTPLSICNSYHTCYIAIYNHYDNLGIDNTTIVLYNSVIFIMTNIRQQAKREYHKKLECRTHKKGSCRGN